jgi:tRNA(Ile)-lysidine synthetase-like protein
MQPTPEFSTLSKNTILFLKEKGFALPLKNVAIAVSGGSDSIALLHLLMKTGNKIIEKSSARVIHINHNWRGASSLSDQQFVEDLAAHYQIPCIVHSVSPPQDNTLSAESFARLQRKEAFSKFELVLTAHTTDDLYETIIWKTLQAKDPGVGIKIKHENEVRPFLIFEKSLLQAYLKSESLKWCEDVTNHDGKLLRSKMRKKLMPMLKEIFPDSKDQVVKKALGINWLPKFYPGVEARKEIKTLLKLPPNTKDILEAWESFKPTIPLSTIITARKARRR